MTYAPTDPAAAPHLLAALSPAPADLACLAEKRAAARDSFAATGLPSARNELWRFTSLKALGKLTLTADTPAAGAVDALPALPLTGDRPRARLVLVNGHYRPDLSQLAAVGKDVGLLCGLANAVADAPDEISAMMGKVFDGDGGPLATLNMAGFTDGAFLLIKPAVANAPLVEIIHVTVSDGEAAPLVQPRLMLVLAPNAAATVVEHHVSVGTGPAVVNQVTEIALSEGSKLRHYIAQRAGGNTLHFATTGATLMQDAAYDSFALNLGGKLARHTIDVRLGATGASCTLDGAYMARGEQHLDTTTRIVHGAPHTTSREVYKGTVDDRAHGVFQGKIVVLPGSVKTDGHQLSRALLLSDHAGMDAKPELEIYADDVKCSHGATCGELDDDALFFLRARGIPKDEARGLLVAAFLAESVDAIADEDVRAGFAAMILTHLGRPADDLTTGAADDSL